MVIYARLVIAGVFAGSLLPSLSAVASPLALRVQGPQLRRLERELKAMPVQVLRDVVEVEGVACFDPVGIRDLDFATQIDELTLAPAPQGGRLDATVLMREVSVRGTMYADGSFPCFGVEETLDPLLLTDVRISIGLRVQVTEGRLLLEVIDTQSSVGAVSITGSETLADLEETFGVVGSMLPDLVDFAAREGIAMANAQIETFRTGVLMGLPYAVTFTSAQIVADGIDFTASLDPGVSEKAACLPAGAVAPVVTSLVAGAPHLDPALSPMSGVILSTSDDLPGNVLGAAWWAGMFCGETTLAPPQLLQETLEQITGKQSGDILLRYNLGRVPRVELRGNRVRVEIEQMHVEMHDPSGTLFLSDFDLTLEGSARIEPDTRLVLAAIDIASLKISVLESGLAADESGRQDMVRYLEERLPGELTSGVQELAVADAVFIDPVSRILLELVHADGGFRAAISPFLVPDPEVDMVAPETSIYSEDHGWKTSQLHMGATDDRDGTLVYSWSVDGGPWSAWTTDSSVTVPLAPGTHEAQAISRDRWGNVDATPATITITKSESAGSCACSTTSASPAGSVAPFALALVALGVASLRRRRAAMALVPALFVLAPAAAFADDSRVMPPGYFALSVTVVNVLNNPPSDMTGSTVDIPTGMFPLGIDAKARERHRMEATIYVPTVVIGLMKNVHGVVYLPVFDKAEVAVQQFEVRAAGVDVTAQAQGALRDAGFKSPTKGADPISTWRGRGIGDLGTMVRWRAIGTRDTALALNAGVKFPTGRRDDPRILTDFGFGDGQFDVSFDALGERRLDYGVLSATAGYKLRLPGETRVRPVGGPTVTTLRDPGDVVRAGVSARTSGAGMRAFSLDGSIVLEHHERDYNSAHLSMPDQHGNAVVIAGSAGVNNIKWFLKHRLGLPAGVAVGAQRSFSPDNPNLEVWQASARVDLYL